MIIGVVVILGLISCVFCLFLLLKIGCSIFKIQRKQKEKQEVVQKAKEEKLEQKKKEFVKYKLTQHEDVPIQQPYGKEMDPDFADQPDEEEEVLNEEEEQEYQPDIHRSGAMRPPQKKMAPPTAKPGTSKSS